MGIPDSEVGRANHVVVCRIIESIWIHISETKTDKEIQQETVIARHGEDKLATEFAMNPPNRSIKREGAAFEIRAGAVGALAANGRGFQYRPLFEKGFKCKIPADGSGGVVGSAEAAVIWGGPKARSLGRRT